ncbi:hypothetical protein H6F98_20215 [Microcoleus sp. FACHB-SPT15]|uniref:hypothetical protein n=1 Tax=Microcoleus sp. FACHB-SPT15 TaxID=2692830 RepID=UPI00177ACCA6|nr:hypothetical protein [Microcoleus sp. FACHB-SPT15]MBD1807755.1 hypothetical protein [Microcoleus sp. FACHB-SPT15]
MSTQSNKNSISKLFSVAGLATASLLLSFPAFALIPTSSAESNGKNQEFLAQAGMDTNGSPRPEGDQNVPTAPSPSDPSVDRVVPGDPITEENNQMQMNEPSSATETNDNMNTQYSRDSDRLKPGTWMCLNNPNPQCES